MPPKFTGLPNNKGSEVKKTYEEIIGTAYKKRLEEILEKDKDIRALGRMGGHELEILFLGKTFSKEDRDFVEFNNSQNSKGRNDPALNMQIQKSREGNNRMSEADALKSVIKPWFDEVRRKYDHLKKDKSEDKPEEPTPVDSGILGNAIQTYLAGLKKEYKIVSSAGTGLDYNYGSDAMVHSAKIKMEDQVPSEIKEQIEINKLMKGHGIYVSVGITTDKRKINQNQKQKRIQSDVEIYIPGDLDFLSELGAKPEVIIKVAALAAVRIHQSYSSKVAGNKHPQPHWIDAEEMLRPSQKSA